MNWPSDALVVLRPELGDLLKAILEPIAKKQPRQAFYRRTVCFIEKLARENPSVQSIEDREKLAEALDLALVELFLSEGHRRYVFTRLFNFLRQFIESYRAPSSLSPDESQTLDMGKEWRQMMRQKNLQHDYPWLAQMVQTKGATDSRPARVTTDQQEENSPVNLVIPSSIAKAWPPEVSAGHVDAAA